MDEATKHELQRKKLCFTYKESWEPRQKYFEKGKIHYIEVESNDENNQENLSPEGSHQQDSKMFNLNHTEKIATLVRCGGTIALAESPRCTVFQVWGTLQGQRVIVMLDSRATLYFINSSLVKRRGLPMEARIGFQVKVIGGILLLCSHLVPQFSITMINHIATKHL